jgi:hypothetical protein
MKKSSFIRKIEKKNTHKSIKNNPNYVLKIGAKVYSLNKGIRQVEERL